MTRRGMTAALLVAGLALQLASCQPAAAIACPGNQRDRQQQHVFIMPYNSRMTQVVLQCVRRVWALWQVDTDQAVVLGMRTL
jgi:hypothetical protein